MPSEAVILGTISLLLTILNIICIFVAGILVLKVKEVAPHTALSEQTKGFWKRDIPVMRNTYRTVKGASGLDFAKQAKQLFAEIQNEANIQDVLQEIKDDPEFSEIAKRMPNNGVDLMNHVSKETHNRLTYVGESPEHDNLLYDRYHTISDPKKAQQILSRCSSCIATPMSDTIVSTTGVGSVVRVRRPVSAMLPEEDDSVLLVDVQQLTSRSKHTPRPQLRHRFLSVENNSTNSPYSRSAHACAASEV